jgi:hypothetical protein
MVRQLKTQADAEAELGELGRELPDPVMPVSRVVAALKSWCECVLAGAARDDVRTGPDWFAVVESMKTVLASVDRTRIDVPAPVGDTILIDRLAVLSSFFGEPVRPLAVLCPAVRAWLRREIDPIFNAKRPAPVPSVQIDIGKSNLLWRLLYAREKVRTKQCPVHRGRWHGPSGPDGSDCPHKCDGTGWLREL